MDGLRETYTKAFAAARGALEVRLLKELDMSLELRQSIRMCRRMPTLHHAVNYSFTSVSSLRQFPSNIIRPTCLPFPSQ